MLWLSQQTISKPGMIRALVHTSTHAQNPLPQPPTLCPHTLKSILISTKAQCTFYVAWQPRVPFILAICTHTDSWVLGQHFMHHGITLKCLVIFKKYHSIYCQKENNEYCDLYKYWLIEIKWVWCIQNTVWCIFWFIYRSSLM